MKVPSERLFEALVAAGIIREGEGIRRVVIDAEVGQPLVLRVERLTTAEAITVAVAVAGSAVA